MFIDYSEETLGERQIVLLFDGEEMPGAWTMFSEVRKHLEPLGVEIPEGTFWEDLQERALAEKESTVCLSIGLTIEFTTAVLRYIIDVLQSNGFDEKEMLFALHAVQRETASHKASPS